MFQFAMCKIRCMKCRFLVCLVQTEERPVQLSRGRERKGWGKGETCEECPEESTGAGGRSEAQILWGRAEAAGGDQPGEKAAQGDLVTLSSSLNEGSNPDSWRQDERIQLQAMLGEVQAGHQEEFSHRKDGWTLEWAALGGEGVSKERLAMAFGATV